MTLWNTRANGIPFDRKFFYRGARTQKRTLRRKGVLKIVRTLISFRRGIRLKYGGDVRTK